MRSSTLNENTELSTRTLLLPYNFRNYHSQVICLFLHLTLCLYVCMKRKRSVFNMYNVCMCSVMRAYVCRCKCIHAHIYGILYALHQLETAQENCTLEH